jgi:hypothetical protein
MAPIPNPDEHDKPNNGEDAVDVMDVPDVMINADSSDSEEEEEGGEFGNDGYQVLQQSLGDSDDEEEEEDMTPSGTVEQGGETVAVDAEVERSTATDETIRLPPGLHTAGGTTPSYMKVNISLT